jgi:hypothetical protein
MKKKFEFLSFIFILLAVNGFSQGTNNAVQHDVYHVPDSLPQHIIKNYTTEQVEIYHSDAISISYHIEDCHIQESGMHKEKVFLRFINNTPKDVAFRFYVKQWRNGNCVNNIPDSPLAIKEVIIPANSSIKGYCGIDAPRSLEIFSKHLNYPSDRLEKFTLTELQLTTISH